MAIEIWLLFLAVSVAPALNPGPGVLLTLTNALTYGPRVAAWTGLVNSAGIAVIAVAVGYGLAALLAASEIAFWILKLVGAAYLIWLGVRIWRDRSAFAVSAERQAAPPPMPALTLQAAAISLTNPTPALSLAALLPPFLDASQPLGPQIWILALTYGGLNAVKHLLLASAAGGLRGALTEPRRARTLRRAAGGAFIGFGAAVAVAGRP